MNIVWIVPGGVDKSGRERVVPSWLWLLEEIAKDHQVLVIAHNQYENYQEYELLGATVINLGKMSRLPGGLKLLRWLWQIWHILKHREVDVIHAFNVAECGLLAGSIGKMLHIPTVATIINGEFIWLSDIKYGWQGTILSRLIISCTVASVDRIVALSEFSRKNIQKRVTHIIPFGVKVSLFPAENPRRFVPPWRLMHVGNISPVKDQTTLLKAIKQVAVQKDIRLDWFGFDTMNGELQRLMIEMDLQEIIHYHGTKSIGEIVPYYQQAHLYVHSSRFESQVVTVVEAAITGLPTVGTNVGLIHDLAPEAAIAIPIKDHERLAHAILELLNNPERMISLGEKAREWTLVHDSKWSAEQYSKLYKETLNAYK